MVDGTKLGPAQLLQALVGDDIVGSQVRLTIRKQHGSRTFDCVVQRGALARIQAVGQLFLMLSKLIADIETDHRVLDVPDLLQVEAQVRVVETTTNIFLNCFKGHVHDLESALFDVLRMSERLIASRTSALHKISTEKTREAQRLAVHVQETEVRLRAALQRESRRERTDKALQNQVDALKIELQGSQELSRELEAQLKASKNRSGDAQREALQLSNRLAAIEGQLSVAQKCSHDIVLERDSLRTQVDMLNAKVKDVESGSGSRAQRLTQQIEALQQSLLACAQEREKAEGERDALDAEVKALKGQLGEVASSAHGKANELMHEVDTLQQKLASSSNELDQQRQTTREVEMVRDALKGEMDALRGQLSEATAGTDNQMQEMKKLQTELSEVSRSRDALKGEVDALRAQLSAATAGTDNQMQEMKKLQTELSEVSRALEHEQTSFAAFKKQCMCESLRAELEESLQARDKASQECDRLQALVSEVSRALEHEQTSFAAFKKQCMCESLRAELEESLRARDKASQECDRLQALVAGAQRTHTHVRTHRTHHIAMQPPAIS